MSFELFLAVRYLRTPRRHRLAQFTAFCAVVGIAFGVAAMILAQSLANGFRDAMQSKILANTAHITVFQKDNTDIFDWQNLSEQLKQIEGVKSVSATTFDNALLVGKINSSYAVLRGSQHRTYQISNLKSQILNFKEENQRPKTKDERPLVEIGRELAEKTGLSVGDAAEILSGSGSFGENFAPTSTEVEVGRILDTGLYEYDSTWIRLSLEDAAKLTGRSSIAASALEIETIDIYKSREISEQIEKHLNDKFKVLDWQEANRPLFVALTLERRVAVLIISLIVFVAVLNITTTLALVVNERKLDIAVLKTCGAKTRSIVFVFLLEGALLGVIGILAGVLLGLTACYICNYFGLLNLPPDVYSVREIVLKPDFENILLTVMVAFVLSLAASSFPAWAAARVRPMDNLRN